MSITSKLASSLGLVTKAQAQQRVNAAREDALAGGDPARTNEPLWKPWDANMRPGMLPYSILRAYAEACEPVRLCINRVKVMMHTLEWDIVPVDEDKPDEAQLEAAKAWFSTEGGVGRPGTMLEEFVDELTEDLLVCGCICTYQRPTAGRAAGLGGNLASIEAIDAATIIPKRDEKGWIPDPPGVAYEQVLRNGKRTPFTRDQLLYRVWGARTFTAYGQSFVECCMSSVLQYNAADAYNMVWFTEGDNVLGYWKYTAGDLSPEEVATFRAWLKKEQKKGAAKGKPVADLTPPAGWEYVSFRPRSESDYLETEKRLYSRIAPFFGLNPSTVGVESNTYKSDQEAQRKQAIATALTPIAQFLGGVFTALLQGPLGLDKCRFVFDLDVVNLFATAQALKLAGTERVTLNEGRERLGLPKLSGGYADDVFVVTSGGEIIVLASTDETRQVEAPLERSDNASTDNTGNEARPPGVAAAAGTAVKPGQPAAERPVGKAGDPCRDDLYRWRTKARKAKAGQAAQVRFVSEAIPEDTQDAIRKALAEGSVDDAFAPHLTRPAEAWADDLGRGLEGLIEQLEEAVEQEEAE